MLRNNGLREKKSNEREGSNCWLLVERAWAWPREIVCPDFLKEGVAWTGQAPGWALVWAVSSRGLGLAFFSSFFHF